MLSTKIPRKRMALLCGILAALAGAACSSHKIDEDVLLLYVRATAFFNEGKFSQAQAMLQDEAHKKAIERFAPALTLRGKAAYFLSDYTYAEADFRRALARQPGQIDAKLYLARVLRERGDMKGALGMVEEIIADNPLDTRALRLAAELTKDAPNGEAASSAYLNRAIETGSEQALALLERARRRWASGRIEEARGDLASAKFFAPQDSTLYEMINQLERAIDKKESLPPAAPPQGERR